MPQKNSPQIVVPKQLSVKHKNQKKKREKIKGDGIIPTQGGVLALYAQSHTYPTADGDTAVIGGAHGCCAVRREHAVVRVECCTTRHGSLMNVRRIREEKKKKDEEGHKEGERGGRGGWYTRTQKQHQD